MKAKFFLCMRPPVMETDEGSDYIKLPPPTVTGKTSGRRNNPGLHQRKRVAPEKFMRQLSINSNSNRFSGGNISEGKSENPIEKDCQKCQKSVISPVSERNIPVPFAGKKTVYLQKLNLISNGEVNGGPDRSNSGVYLMATSLFFTIFLGKFIGILCTLMLLYFLFPRRKMGVENDNRRLINMVGKSPKKLGSPEEYKKRVIMEGLLERKSHNRESIKFF